VSLSAVTLVANRAAHLGHLIAGLCRSTTPVDELVIVDMGSTDDPGAAVAGIDPGFPVRWIHVRPGPDGELPLARARNAGAQRAAGDALLFLDVDCIPSGETAGAYADAVGRGGVVCGPVRWLERSWDVGLDLASPSVDDVLGVRSNLNAVRPDPTVERTGDDHELFWSLAFGLSRATWETVGGFDEGYVGYGAEDTDFGFAARRAGVPLRWIPAGTVFHQFHRSSNPPVEHLAAIVANARRFRSQWGVWPMEGWLASFAARGLVAWDPAGTEIEVLGPAGPRAGALRVASVPASHPYTRKVYDASVRVLPDGSDPWWPHPVLEGSWPRRHADEVDVVHVHFGFEHRSAAELEEWCGELAAAGVALVVTVHDLVDPHGRVGAGDHRTRLGVLVAAAAEVITLTDAAADQVWLAYGRPATVIAHPRMVPDDVAGPRRPGPPRVGVHFKTFRANLLGPEAIIPALAEAAARTGADVVVVADDHAERGALDDLREHGRRAGIEATVAPRMDDARLAAFIGDLDVLVLPYRFGTHSGMIEACRDLGTRAVVTAKGCYRDQWVEVVTCPPPVGGALDPVALADAVTHAVRSGAPAAAPRGWRAAQLAEVQDAHRAVAVTAMAHIEAPSRRQAQPAV
jgi:GT2 family glycosyltransferase